MTEYPESDFIIQLEAKVVATSAVANHVFTVEVTDSFSGLTSGLTLEVTAPNVAMACASAIKTLARDRSRPVDLDSMQLRATRKDVDGA